APSRALAAMIYCAVGAGVLARNYARLKDANERRRVRGVVLGFPVAITAFVIQFGTAAMRKSPPLLAGASTRDLLFAPFTIRAPGCMAYAIILHRIFHT